MENKPKELQLLIEKSALVPTQKRIFIGLIVSLLVHALGYTAYRFTPALQLAYDLRGIEFVDEAYDRAILLKLSRPLKYPGDYLGFAAPTKTLDLEKLKAIEKSRAAALKRAAEEARKKRARAAEIKQQQIAAKQPEIAPTPTPSPKPTPSGFKPINTRPIREQIQRLYDLKQEGKLAFNESNFRVGVMGEIKYDGAIANARVFIKSGNPQIDQAALAILDAVSESRALGPLSQLTSLSMILTIDEQRAQLVTVGFAPDANTASSLQGLATGAILLGKKLKAADPASMIFLDNLKVSQSANRVQAVIAVPRQTAVDTLSKTMAKK